MMKGTNNKEKQERKQNRKRGKRKKWYWEKSEMKREDRKKRFLLVVYLTIYFLQLILTSVRFPENSIPKFIGCRQSFAPKYNWFWSKFKKNKIKIFFFHDDQIMKSNLIWNFIFDKFIFKGSNYKAGCNEQCGFDNDLLWEVVLDL